MALNQTPEKDAISSVMNYSCMAVNYLKTHYAHDDTEQRLMAFHIFLNFFSTKTLKKCSR